MTAKRTVRALVVGIGLGFAGLVTLFLLQQLQSPVPPEQVAESFFLETYIRDYSAAWERVSAQDKAARGKVEYLADNPATTAAQAVLFDQLANWGEFQPLAVVSSNPEQAIVSAHVRYPDSGQDSVEQLIASAGQPNADSAVLIQELTLLYVSDGLQFVDSDVSFDLVREHNQWRIVQHWGHDITVLLEAAVSPDLPWDFYPLQSQIVAVPGDLIKATYLARNNSDQTITAKAVHEVGPDAAEPYFQTVQCFCFTEQTLEPGEEREMTLLFRIDLSTPRELETIDNRYTFYTLGDFPSEG